MSEINYPKAAFNRREERWSHVSYKDELILLEALKRGELELYSDRLQEYFPIHSGHLSDNPHRQAMYEFVACVTLVTRFAIEGGVASQQAFTFSDTYIKTADNAGSVAEIRTLYNNMLSDFLTLVKRAKNTSKSYSLTTVNAIRYIDKNLHYKITLDDIAKYVNRNAAYLCNNFKKETGLPISQYINREKISVACHLLRDTSMTVSEIAASLAYGSQNYFTRIFVSLEGATPTQYRKMQAYVH